MENDKTINFSSIKQELDAYEILSYVKEALDEKGYDYKNQIVGYLISGDPSYLPRHNNSRNIIKSIDRDIIIEELLTFYLENKSHE